MTGTRLIRFALEAVDRGRISPGFQKAVWRWWYEAMTRRWRDADWTFMNFGYLPNGVAPPLALDARDEKDRCFIGLYHHVLGDLDLAGQCVLEVGSGRGGGASYVARYRAPAELVGLDYAAAAIALSRRLHRAIPNLRFVEGDAENLPFADSAFDVVVNVESSHCYGDMAAFVAGVARVLKPGGHFCWADIRGPGMVARTDRAFADSGLTPVRELDITANVVRALDDVHERKMRLIDGIRFGRSALREFSGTRGSMLYRALKSGEAVYLSRTFRKPAG